MEFTTFVLLIATMLSMSLINVFKKLYKKSAPIFLSLCSTFFTLLFFVVAFFITSGFNFTIDENMLKYAIPYCACYLLSAIFSLLALSCGDLSLTGLFISFSLIIPTLYGIIIGDEVGITFFIGLALFFVCLVLVNVKFKKIDGKEKKPISLKWVIFVIIGAVSNGCSSIFQTAHQKATGGKFGSEFMIIALAIALVVYAVITLFAERGKIKDAYKRALPLGAIIGVLTGTLNLLVMMFTGQSLLPVAIFFPVLSGGTLIITFIIGFFFYKEKYDFLQYVGIICGLASVILLNI